MRFTRSYTRKTITVIVSDVLRYFTIFQFNRKFSECQNSKVKILEEGGVTARGGGGLDANYIKINLI